MNLSKAAETESKNSNSQKNWKEYWKNTELVPSSREDKQLPFLIATLKKELDISKIETVLEVGVGYGRVAKAILEEFPNVEAYTGIDISQQATDKSREYVTSISYGAINSDFEDVEIEGYWDLVISVETLSAIPEDISVQPWIDKMVSLSKKYVVNLDYTTTTHPIFNNGHDYYSAYHKHETRTRMFFLPDKFGEELFICWVK